MNDYDKLFLSKFEFLNNLDAEQRKHFFKISSYKHIDAGTVIYGEKFNNDKAVFVITGKFRVFAVSDSGRKISLYSFKAGEANIFNKCFFDNTDVSVMVMAVQDSLIAEISCNNLCYLLSDSPYIQHFLIDNMTLKFIEMIKLIQRLTFNTVTERLWDYLLAKTVHGKKPLYRTHDQIATELGTSREVVTRRLNKLKNAGLIKIERGRLILLEPNADISHLTKPACEKRP